MILDKTVYRQVLGHLTTGVAVLTTCSQARLVGLTISSFCSVSLDPPLVLACLDLQSNTLASLRESGIFAVNILTDQQEHISRSFAVPSKDRYEHFCHVGYWQTMAGTPIIDGALAFIEARIVSEYPGGDHVILLGQVQALGVGNELLFDENGNVSHPDETTYRSDDLLERVVSPLLHYCGRYHYLTLESQHPRLEPDKELHYAIRER